VIIIFTASRANNFIFMYQFPYVDTGI